MDEQTNQSLERLLGTIRRRVAWIVLCTVLAAGAAYGYSKHQAKKYTATTVLAFKSNQLGQQIAGLPGAGTETQQQSTNVRLLQLGDVAAKTARRLRGRVSAGEVSAALSVSSQGESSLVDLSATARSGPLAARIANTYAQQFVAEQQSSNHAYYLAALKLINKQLAALNGKERSGPLGLALEGRAQSLGVLAELRNPNVQVVQAAAVPGSPSSPRILRSTLLGAAVGLLLGLGVALLLERLDSRIRDPKDLQAIHGVPLLGVLPESTALSQSAKHRPNKRGKQRAKEALPSREQEAFELIRARLRYFNIDRELRTLLIVSAALGEGRTTIARQLASAAARMGSVVLLLEADLRSPALAEQVDLQPRPGLSDVLIGDVSLWSATQLVDVDSQPVDGSAGRSLDVLAAGVPPPPNPAKLIESQAMAGVLEEAGTTYDLVVIDTPPLTVFPDAFPLLRKVDGVIVVGRGGRSRRDVAERLHETLSGAHAPLLGVVANGFKVRPGRSYEPTYDSVPAAHSAAPTRRLADSSAAAPEEPLPEGGQPSPRIADASRARDNGFAGDAVEDARVSSGD
jgi:capsular exopolysaccharide synthesis family protein